jgi:hypothetical protein
MPTQTKTRGASTTRFGRTSTPATGRGRFARGRTTPTRRPTPTPGLRRRKPQQSGLKKVMGSLMPTAAAKKAAPSSKKGKAGGLALAAAAAGMAFKNRDKLTQRLHRENQQPSEGTLDASRNSTTPPAAPAV